ncbi:hypothetical protein CANINC_000365 [Pichia inconspicua]|uniref:HIG1 domain-containing protein n=1 Tax=Pichia inconspicua TaxID=52247 RepID=A0A4T0X6R9_9ASCO|nr:hypothetical protein CANINC_000365 [[Candida] inconspicua]
MKLATQEELQAQRNVVMVGGFKGLLLGTAISVGIFAAAPKYYPRIFKMPWSIKTAIFVTPPAFVASVNAELCSNEFDYNMYSSEASQKRILEEHQRWNSLNNTEKSVEILSNNKFKIITGLWAASLYGSWWYVNKDHLLTKTQKLVQARMYAQFITVGLLLGTIGLSMYEENMAKEHKKIVFNPDDEALKDVLNSKD